MKLSAKAQAAMGKVVAQFQQGDLSPIVEIAGLKRKGDAVPFDTWSFTNRVMTYIMSGGSTDLRGYRQWQEVGRQVKKGSKAAFIFVPRFIKKVNEEGEEERRLRGFLTVPVFAAHDTEGEPLPELDYSPAQMPPLMGVAERLGVAVTWQAQAGQALGSSNTTGSRISLRTHDAEVFFHELAHAVHARLNGRLKGGQHADQETVAQFTACVLMGLYGMGDRTGNSWQYIASYNEDPLRAIMQALDTVGKVLEALESSSTLPSRQGRV